MTQIWKTIPLRHLTPLPVALAITIALPTNASPTANSRAYLQRFASVVRESQKEDKTKSIRDLSKILNELKNNSISDFGYARGLTPLLSPHSKALNAGKRLKLEALCARGQLYLSQNNTTLANRDFEQCVSLNPGHYDSIIGKSSVAIQRKNFASAHKLLNAACKIDKENPKAYFTRAHIYKLTRDTSSMEESLARGRRLQRIKSYHLSLLSRSIDQSQSQTKKTYPVIRKLLAANPRDPAIICLLASTLSLDGKQNLALDTLDIAANLAPDSELELLVRSKILSKLHRGKEAAVAAKKALAIRPDSETGLNNLAVAQLQMGLPDEAVKTLSKLIRLNPRNPIYFANRADAYIKSGRNAQAIKDADSALRLDPQMNLAENNKAVALINLKRYREAETLLNHLLGRNPYDYLALVNRCVSRINLGKSDKAAEDLRQAYNLDPDSYKALIKSTIMRNHTAPCKADLLHALFIANRVAQFSPDDGQVYYNRALIYFNLDQATKASMDLRKFIELSKWQGKSTVCAAILCYLADIKSGKGVSSRRILYKTNKRCPAAKNNLELQYFLGKFPESKLLDKSRSNGLKTRAHCYIGLRESLMGKRDPAIHHLRWVKMHGEKKMDEYVLSITALSRLQKNLK